MQLKPGMDSYKCEYCQSVHFPDKNDDGVRILADQTDADHPDQPVQNCPVCSIPLKLASIDKFRILYCTQCHGMLIPMEEFQVLIDDLQALQRDTIVPPAVDKSDLRRTINCPHCSHAMEAHLYGGPGNVVIDSCDNCSLNWLDHGELMRIVHAPDERSSGTFVASASAYTDSPGTFRPGIDDRNDSSGLWGGNSTFRFSSGANSGPNSNPDLFDAIASLFRR
jgi:Zn-finger nucleic acid-binding protein